MNRRILVIVAVVFALVALALVLALRQQPRRPAEMARTDAPLAAPLTSGAPRVPDAPVSEPARPSARRATPTPEPAPAPVEAPVEAAPEVGTLRIESDVPGAQVFIDRQFVGATPVTAQNVKPGTHQLNVSAEGFEGIARTIDVEPGPRDITLRFREVRLDARIAVVHKHRIGSCRGQLVATPQGLRYETTDKDDAFAAQLLNLETFQVDYLEKNLKLKPRGGKQYNFTDPDGNADRLFVFHRDVDKVRDRLRKGDQPAAP
ncbi:MAG: PEGA domain-containing protein [Vicinamibacterales bacterium]